MSTAKPHPDDHRTGTMLAVAVPVARVTKPIFGRAGFAGGALVMDWPAIVGPAVASHTLPMRIRFPPKERTGGTLEIKVASSAFATELAHLEPLIVERVNGYFGWKAVARLKLRHGPLPVCPAPKPPPPPPDAPLPPVIDTVEDPELRAVLERLGRHLGARKP